MKILLVNGSPRKEGNTYTALKELATQLERNGVDSEILWIGNKPVRGCIACNVCKTKSLLKCAFDDDICNEIIDKIKSCDGIVLGSPVYYGQPSGQLIAIQQRMLHSSSVTFANKPAAVVCVCRRGGATSAFQTLQMPFQMCNMPLAGSQYWNIAYGRGEGESAQDVEGMQTMRCLADNLAWMVKNLSGKDTPEREPWQPMHFIR